MRRMGASLGKSGRTSTSFLCGSTCCDAGVRQVFPRTTSSQASTQIGRVALRSRIPGYGLVVPYLEQRRPLSFWLIFSAFLMATAAS